MKRFPFYSLVLALFLASSLSSCDLLGSDDDVDDPSVNVLGFHEEFGTRSTIAGATVAENVARGFFRRTFRFDRSRAATVTVQSDIVSESGTAEGSYAVDDGALRIIIESSTSTYYQSGETVRYDQVRAVDASFSTTFDEEAEDASTFRGPGLILEAERPDENDLNENGDTSETLTERLYLARPPQQ